MCWDNTILNGKCKYCNELDYLANMHCDMYTREYYHDKCRLGNNKEKGEKGIEGGKWIWKAKH